jgi:hypothetical protein
MSTFWTHLQRLAHGQLFNGGYMRVDDAIRTVSAGMTAKPLDKNARAEGRKRDLPTAQVVACQ